MEWEMERSYPWEDTMDGTKSKGFPGITKTYKAPIEPKIREAYQIWLWCDK